jgi:hypothetical protein
LNAGKCFQILAALACAALHAACSDDSTSPPDEDDFEPTEPALLSTGSPTRDEDPSVLRAQDGRLFVTWFSDRGANPDIYLTSTRDGSEWTPAVRVTTDAGGDFYGNLLQDEDGVFHLTWFRWTALFLGHIWYNRSFDGLTWDPATETQVTTVEGVDDWVPVLAQAPDGTLLIYFVSEARDDTNATSEIFVSAKGPADAAWNAAVPATGINSATENDHLPYAARSGGGVTLIWSRYDTSEPLPWLNPKSDLFAATSLDGFVWSAPMKISNDAGNVAHLFAQIFSTHDGDDALLWLSTRTGAARPYTLPLTDLEDYPGAIAEVSALPEGYSHRVAATSTPGIYLGVWVQGPDGEQEIYYRFFAM